MGSFHMFGNRIYGMKIQSKIKMVRPDPLRNGYKRTLGVKDIISKEYYLREIAERNNVSITFVKDLKKGKHRKDICEQYGLSK